MQSFVRQSLEDKKIVTQHYPSAIFYNNPREKDQNYNALAFVRTIADPIMQKIICKNGENLKDFLKIRNQT